MASLTNHKQQMQDPMTGQVRGAHERCRHVRLTAAESGMVGYWDGAHVGLLMVFTPLSQWPVVYGFTRLHWQCNWTMACVLG